MTRDEARRRAVEAAAKTWWADGYDNNPSYNEDMRLGMSAAIAAYERAMARRGVADGAGCSGARGIAGGARNH